VHVPTAWNAMLAFTFAFACALAVLWRGSWAWDCRLEAAIEVGVVFSALLCVQGSVWARPTWWNSLHQVQSSPETVSSAFHLPLRLNAVGVLLLMSGLIALRARLAALRLATELPPLPPLPAAVPEPAPR
jgi:ABC-type transport system involved in cytochrome c biogenesis permease subunit